MDVVANRKRGREDRGRDVRDVVRKKRKKKTPNQKRKEEEEEEKDEGMEKSPPRKKRKKKKTGPVISPFIPDKVVVGIQYRITNKWVSTDINTNEKEKNSYEHRCFS